LAVAPAFAQTQSNTTYIETSKFIGRPVKSAQGDEIGTVKDIVLDRNTGCLAYTVLSTTGGGGGGGTRVSGGGKMVAVPWAVYSPSTDPNVLTVTVEEIAFITRQYSITLASKNIPDLIISTTCTATMG